LGIGDEYPSSRRRFVPCILLDRLVLLRAMRPGLIVARQAHSEHGFFLVGTHVDLATMRPGNFANDRQSEHYTIVSIMALLRTSR
jgi:hypothetical protein